jgi:hypothetical protein
MSLDTYAGLKNQVVSFLHRASLLDAVGSDNVPDIIRLGELWIFRKARAPEMEATLSGQIDGTTGLLTVPSDYAALKHARLSASPTVPLKMRATRWLLERYPLRSAEGRPHFIGRDGSNFIFGPFPDSAYTVDGVYYAKPTTIATSANTLFLANPDLYLYAALAEAEAYVKNDKRILIWIAKRDSICKDVNNEADEGRFDDMAVEPG